MQTAEFPLLSLLLSVYFRVIVSYVSSLGWHLIGLAESIRLLFSENVAGEFRFDYLFEVQVTAFSNTVVFYEFYPKITIAIS